MDKMKWGKTCRGQTFKIALGITALALLMLVGIAGAAPFAYITNGDSNSVSVIDTATNRVTATIPVGSSPMGAAISPDGTKVYVANSKSNDISIIDTATNAVKATVPLGSTPEGIAIAPDGKKVYVAISLKNTLAVIDTATNTVTSRVNVGKSPAGVAVSSNGKKVYVTNKGDNTLSVIDTTTNKVTATVPVGSGPEEVAVTPDGTKVYVVNYDSGSLSVIDTATNKVTGTAKIGRAPLGVAVSPDGKKVYIANKDEYVSTVSVIDTATNTVTSTVPVGNDPQGVGVSPDGKKVYVAIHLYNAVSVIDTATNTVSDTVLVGNGPGAFGQFIGSIPVQPVYPSANFSNNVTKDYVFTSVPVQFTDLSKNAAGWNWDFGDGFNSTRQNPTHTYSKAGIYTVSLTVDNSNGTDSKLATINVVPKGAPAPSYAYITNLNSNIVSVINTANNTVTATVPAGNEPQGVAVSPDGTRVYVANIHYGSGGTVTIFDTATSKVKATVPIGYKYSPCGIAVTPDGTKAYVTDRDIKCVSVIDTDTGTVTATIPVGANPLGVVIGPDGKKAYVANRDSNTLSVIDTATNKVTATVPVEKQPTGVAVSPAGTKVYVTNGGSNSVSVIDTTTDKVTAIVPVGYYPFEVAVSPVGTEVYVTNNKDNSVSVINTTTNTVSATVKVGSSPYGISITPDGTKAYVANSDGRSVYVIDTATNKVTAKVPFGFSPIAFGQFIGPLPAQPVLPVANFGSNNTSGYAPLSVQFTDLSKSATAWNWDFGDGATSTGQNPVHIYSAKGNYKVTLKAANANSTDLESVNITVLARPAFSASPTSGKTPLTVRFTDQSIGSPTSWKWDFGDKTNSTEKNPVHIYNRAGQYSVTLTLDKSGGSGSKVTKSSYIVISNGFEAPVAAFSAVQTSGKAPLTVSFTDQSTGSPTSWKWSFGDGKTSTEKNPVHTYSEPKLFSVKLTASNEYGSNSLTKSSYVAVSNVLNAPVAAFSASPAAGKVPLPVSFTDQSTGSPTSWKWNFGDGTGSTEKNPVHTYNKTGKYTVTLAASNPNGKNELSKAGYIVVSKVSNAPVAAFSASPTSGKAPFKVQFTDQSTGSPASWKWSFGDGNNSAEKNPVHTYNKSGLYSVTLTVSDAGGSNALTKSGYIVIPGELNAPVTSFSAAPTSEKAPLTVHFTDQSTGSPTSWKWDFGDRSNSTDKDPVHTYNKPGKYTITLTTTNAGGSDMVRKSGYVNITSGSGIVTPNPDYLVPLTVFSATPISGKAPLTVSFTDQSTGLPNSRKWTFGDGTGSMEKNPVHTYNKSGKYSVTLSATNANGSNALTKTSYIFVSSVSNGPVSAFSASPTSGKAPFKVQFTDQSTGSPTSWKWTFGDSTISTEKNPVHTYNKSGLYSVTLTASNANGSTGLTKTSYIAVSNIFNAPVAAFSASPISGKEPLTVSFTDQSTGSPTSWKWTFKDGTSSTEQNPVHTFNKSGLYSVTLTANNANGSTGLTKTSYIAVSNVSNAPVAAFSASQTSGSMPLSVNFADQSTGSPTSWKWDFGDRNTSTDKNPVHTFNKTGLYSVTLTASNANGSNALTKTSYIAVSNVLNAPVSASNAPVSTLNAPDSAFSATPTSGPVSHSVSKTDNSTGSPASRKWDFGDGTNSREKKSVYMYSKTGQFTVSLKVNNMGAVVLKPELNISQPASKRSKLK